MAYRDQGLDVATDGKGWQWGVASVVTVALLVVVAPLLVVVAAVDRACRR